MQGNAGLGWESRKWRQGGALLLLVLALAGCRARGTTVAVVESRPAEQAPPVMAAIATVLPAEPTTVATGTPSPPLGATATASPPPSSTPTLTPSPVPTRGPSLRQLTSGGCCVNPTWRADSGAVRFLDKPAPDAPVGIYEVAVDGVGPVAAGTLVTTTLPAGTGDTRFAMEVEDTTTTLEDLRTGQTYTIPSEGNSVTVSPGATRVTWLVRDPGDLPTSQRQAALWVANLDGSEARPLLRERGLSFSGWLGDEAVLLQLRDANDPDDRLLVQYRLEDGATTVLDRAARYSGLSISPGGSFLTYYVSLDQDDPEQNGIWVVDVARGAKQRLPVTGGYRWRDAARLLVIPMELDAPAFRLQEFDARTGALRDLTDPTVLPLRVANNDWAVAPDGSQVVFVSAADGNLWLLMLDP